LHAGAPYSFWIGFHVLVVALLLVDLLFLSRGKHGLSARTAWLWTGFLILLAAGFAVWINWNQGWQKALEFTSGYLIETSLSVDNLFVFLLMFRSFRLTPHEQHQALLWGISGAIIMRAAFIFAGVALLERFAWIQYVFGAFLLIAAIRLMRPHHQEDKPSIWNKWIPQRDIVSPEPLKLRTFLIVILAVEITDVVFALDSIPAVLAVTRNPFIVYTSNIFAILGLRSLFFALASFLNRFHLLHYGLAAILAFVALKMLLSNWIEVPILVSLGVILAVLAICVVLSLLIPAPAKPQKSSYHTS
jgi:tellurite resistance protein TerC